MDDKNNEALKLIPKLTESTLNTSNSIDKIITNLQYQDIIQQKIAHIQQTHRILSIKSMISAMREMKKQIIKNVLVGSVQIRDIAGLQAAQLIHANKEYQKAIEFISDRFLEVGNEMTGISNLCHQLIGNASGSNTSYFETIREKLETQEYYFRNTKKINLFSWRKNCFATEGT